MELDKVDRDAIWLGKLFDECVDYIESLIQDALAQSPKQRSLVYWRRRSLMVHNELRDIRHQLLRRTPDVIKTAYEYGHDIAHVTTDGLDEPTAAQNFGSGLNKRAIALLAAGLNEKLDMALVTVGRRSDDAFRKAGLRAAAYHAVAGTDMLTAARHMELMLKRDSIRAFTDKAGHEWALNTYTKMVIRTTTREAVTQGTFNGLQATGHDLYQVSHHINACDLCMNYDGKTFLMPGVDVSRYTGTYKEAPDVPSGYGNLPPYHPQCKHVIAPAKVEFDLVEAELLAKYGGAPAVAA